MYNFKEKLMWLPKDAGKKSGNSRSVILNYVKLYQLISISLI